MAVSQAPDSRCLRCPPIFASAVPLAVRPSPRSKRAVVSELLSRLPLHSVHLPLCLRVSEWIRASCPGPPDCACFWPSEPPIHEAVLLASLSDAPCICWPASPPSSSLMAGSRFAPLFRTGPSAPTVSRARLSCSCPPRTPVSVAVSHRLDESAPSTSTGSVRARGAWPSAHRRDVGESLPPVSRVAKLARARVR